MTTIFKELIPSMVAETVLTTQYAPSRVTATIDKFTATNTGTDNETISIYLNAELAVKNRTIVPGQTYGCSEIIGHYLEEGSAISTLSSGNIVIRCSGREIS